jgi:hypothetical protein
VDQTKTCSIGWVETADENEYKLVYDDYAVSIRRIGVDYPHYRLSIYNDVGTEIDYPHYRLSIYNDVGTEIDSLEAHRGGLIEADDSEHFKSLQELYELARHEGTRADQILDNLVERVGGAS